MKIISKNGEPIKDIEQVKSLLKDLESETEKELTSDFLEGDTSPFKGNASIGLPAETFQENVSKQINFDLDQKSDDNNKSDDETLTDDDLKTGFCDPLCLTMTMCDDKNYLAEGELLHGAKCVDCDISITTEHFKKLHCYHCSYFGVTDKAKACKEVLCAQCQTPKRRRGTVVVPV